MENAGVNVIIAGCGVFVALVLALEYRAHRTLSQMNLRAARHQLASAMIEQGQTWRNN
jgi:hypothetical protein